MDSLTIKVASYQGRGEEAQYGDIWSEYNEQGQDPREGKWYCASCSQRIASQSNVGQNGSRQRELHHLVKQHYFPSMRQINKDCGADLRAHKSRNAEANLIPLCPSCHGRWEDWEGGRPHIMTWLFSDITGEEIDLALWPKSKLHPEQRTRWSCSEAVALRQGNSACLACGHARREARKHLYKEGQVELTYTGPDVRAVHVIPPAVAPKLAHVPQNLILLCWECLFGSKAVTEWNSQDELAGWKDEPYCEWILEFAPWLDMLL